MYARKGSRLNMSELLYTVEELAECRKQYAPLTDDDWGAFFKYVDLSKLPEEEQKDVMLTLKKSADNVPYLRKMIREQVALKAEAVLTASLENADELYQSEMGGAYRVGEAHIQFIMDQKVFETDEILYHELLHSQHNKLMKAGSYYGVKDIFFVDYMLQEAEAQGLGMIMNVKRSAYIQPLLDQNRAKIEHFLQTKSVSSFANESEKNDFVLALAEECTIGQLIDVFEQPTREKMIATCLKHEIPMDEYLIIMTEKWHKFYDLLVEKGQEEWDYSFDLVGLSEQEQARLNYIRSIYQARYPVLKHSDFLAAHAVFPSPLQDRVFEEPEETCLYYPGTHDPAYIVRKWENDSYIEFIYKKDGEYPFRVTKYDNGRYSLLVMNQEEYDRIQKILAPAEENILKNKTAGEKVYLSSSLQNQEKTLQDIRQKLKSSLKDSAYDLLLKDVASCLSVTKKGWKLVTNQKEKQQICYVHRQIFKNKKNNDTVCITQYKDVEEFGQKINSSIKLEKKYGGGDRIVCAVYSKYGNIQRWEKVSEQSAEYTEFSSDANHTVLAKRYRVCDKKEPNLDVEYYLNGRLKSLSAVSSDGVFSGIRYDADGKMMVSEERKANGDSEIAIYYNNLEQTDVSGKVSRQVYQKRIETKEAIRMWIYRQNGKVLSEIMYDKKEKNGEEKIYSDTGGYGIRAVTYNELTQNWNRSAWVQAYNPQGELTGYYYTVQGEFTNISLQKRSDGQFDLLISEELRTKTLPEISDSLPVPKEKIIYPKLKEKDVVTRLYHDKGVSHTMRFGKLQKENQG